MAKGYQKHQARKAELSLLGKTLTRRANARCELCERGERALSPHEVTPVEAEPSIERTVLLCETCIQVIEGGAARADDWRLLEEMMWSAIPPVQVLAVRLLRHFQSQGAAWCESALDTLYLESEIEAWIEA